MTYEIRIGGRTASVEVRKNTDGSYVVSIDGAEPRPVAASQVGRAEWVLTDDDGRRQVAVRVAGEQVTAQVGGHGLSGEIVDPREHALDGGAGAAEGLIRSPMPGAMARVLVKVGDIVHAGQVLVVVEAMKMENEFRSPIDGEVVEIGVAAGTTIEGNTMLVVVEPR